MAVNLVLLHGGGQGSWVWDDLIAALRLQAGDEVNAVPMDLAGCGLKRDRDVSEMSTLDVAREFVEELDAAGLRDVVLAGHSGAGITIAAAAALRPDLIRRYVHISTIVAPPEVTLMEFFLSGVADMEYGDFHAQARASMCNDMTPDQADEFLGKLGFDAWPTEAVMLTERDWAYDHLATTDTAYVMCLQDRCHTIAWQEEFAERVHASRIHHIDAGHQVMNTRPHALAEILLAEVRR
ncbi:alpha/beta fold hydrolase [Microbacterium gorillae]|uniref:alpha/beta fold hydrolase n=1 Tax=Microbacterium gorillae TaxID=1231063 RepID=UPI00058F2070|nr:alpha/beta hydrolase [Microbacterium gorillae]